MKHGVSANDPIGDQGHGSSCFGSFHRALVLEFEQAVLSVVPSLKALPYWDSTLDYKGGRYYNTSSSMFSPKYAGTRPALPENNYQVADGVFAWHEIPSFNNNTYSQYSWIFNGSATGQLRSPDSTTTTKYLTSFPYNPPEDVLMTCFGSTYANYTSLWRNSTLQGLDINYTSTDYARCYDPTFSRDWTEWHWCIDYNSFVHNTQPTPDMISKYTTNLSPFLHPYTHRMGGGLYAYSSAGKGVLEGDFNDLATSPNEVLMFFTHHANIDRNLMIWQTQAERADRNMADKAVMWGFPKSARDLPLVDPAYPSGCYLNDVVNANFPFTDIFTTHKPTGYTHFDVLDNTRPGKADYTYDNMS